MSRSSDAFTHHINSGGDEPCRQSCVNRTLTESAAVELLTQLGYTVVPPVVAETVR
jgi:hypothetical protein